MAALKRGTVRAFDAPSHTATIQIEDSPGTMSGIPVNRGIAAADMISGRTVAVVFFDATHQTDMMIIGVY
jgi:hypothetical protein